MRRSRLRMGKSAKATRTPGLKANKPKPSQAPRPKHSAVQKKSLTKPSAKVDPSKKATPKPAKS